MACVEIMPDVVVCRPTTLYQRTVEDCPTCGRRRRFVSTVALWYDPVFTCCGCGDSWSTGGRMPRPFARGWRPSAIERARKHWAAGSTRAEVRRWLAEELRAEREFAAGQGQADGD